MKFTSILSSNKKVIKIWRDYLITHSEKYPSTQAAESPPL